MNVAPNFEFIDFMYHVHLMSVPSWARYTVDGFPTFSDPNASVVWAIVRTEMIRMIML
jgi:hypothetical protein